MSQAALKSSTAVRRFIVVQHDAVALFGLFSIADGESIEEKAIDSVAPWTDHPDEGKVNVLDTDGSKTDRVGLSVYEVPIDFPAYDEADTSIDASSVHDGKLFADYDDFPFVGAIVELPIMTIIENEYGDAGNVDRDLVWERHGVRISWQLLTNGVHLEISGPNGTGGDGKLEGDYEFEDIVAARELMDDLVPVAAEVFAEARENAIDAAGLKGDVDHGGSSGAEFAWNVWCIDGDGQQTDYVIDEDGDLIEV